MTVFKFNIPPHPAQMKGYLLRKILKDALSAPSPNSQLISLSGSVCSRDAIRAGEQINAGLGYNEAASFSFDSLDPRPPTLAQYESEVANYRRHHSDEHVYDRRLKIVSDEHSE
ncbi:hypothetical protein EVAR_101993_1 [Eumeta japonica]|uniref:Uncharacterized protein n=1 Tax=Eumeta variegata TaxID=151549 RepID=A0A4C1TSM8_EUMVA|nr:hypothetical protein EVAR_101993_1 [Eumeta japonica]